MNGVQCPHRNGKRLQGAGQHGSNHLDHRNSADQIAYGLSMRILQPLRIDAIPNLAFKKPAGHQLQVPELIRWESIFCQQMCERHRTIEIDHRSARSRCRLLRSSSIVITGLRAGGPRPIESGGVIQPWRKASNNRASDSTELRVGLGGPISATTRSRSVTRTVSPPAASRTYSLSLFLSVLRPTERMI